MSVILMNGCNTGLEMQSNVNSSREEGDGEGGTGVGDEGDDSGVDGRSGNDDRSAGQERTGQKR